MNHTLIGQVIRFNPDDDGHYGILRRSKVVLSPGGRPYGYVLRDLGEKFVTHMAYYRVGLELVVEDKQMYQAIMLSSDGFDSGHYFEHGEHRRSTREQALDMATEDFVDRCRKL